MPKVSLVPSLRFENWRSMDIYHTAVLDGLSRTDLNDIVIETLEPSFKENPNRLERAFIKYHLYPALLSKEWEKGVDLFHHLDHGYAHLLQESHRSVITVHDLTHFEFPELSGFSLKFWRRRMAGLRKAEHLIAVTQNVADLLVKYLTIPAAKITVGYHELEPVRFLNVDRAKASEHWSERLGSNEASLVASVGTACHKKNLGVLLRAILALRAQGMNVKLIRMGAEIPDGEWGDLRDELMQDGGVVELGYLPHEEIAQVLTCCDMLAFPSKYEGFGMPLMEAQALSLPVVAARASCLPEVAGEGAYFHEPDSVEDLASLIKKVAEGGPEIEEKVALGIENVKRFSPGLHSKILGEVYESLLG